jgi:hypothetical protein
MPLGAIRVLQVIEISYFVALITQGAGTTAMRMINHIAVGLILDFL